MSASEGAVVTPQPFLKWAGGKRALLPDIRQRMPAHFERYIEPFLGAGAVLLDQPKGLPKIASDQNAELIAVYEVIRDKPTQLLRELRNHINTEEHYYEVRSWDRVEGFEKLAKVKKAARFIYLNKCGYNGLFRVNARGQMNVPFGRYSNPDFINEQNIRTVSSFLNARSETGGLLTQLRSGDYRDALNLAKPGDFAYCDPPYAPLSDTASFTSYVAEGFTLENQEELRDEVLRLTHLGVHVLLSNADVPLIRKLFSDRKVFTIDKVSVHRPIAASATKRVKVDEVLINNYKALGG